MIRAFSKNFAAGLLIIFPAILTVAIVQAVFQWVFSFIIDPLAKVLIPGTALETLLVTRLGVFAGFILVVSLVGFATRALIIRRFLHFGEALLRRVPMVGKIYWTIREIANTFRGERRGVFTNVVLLEWPRPGIYAVGFVTSKGQKEIQEKTGQAITNVFLPTSPNPTSGYLIMVPVDALTFLEMSVEDGMRLVISGGVSGPEDPKLAHPQGASADAPPQGGR